MIDMNIILELIEKERRLNHDSLHSQDKQF